MTILVAYVPRPEGLTAVEKGIELAGRFGERLLVMYASDEEPPLDGVPARKEEIDHLEVLLAKSGVDADFRQFARGKTPVQEIERLLETTPVSMLVIGLRKRSPLGKILLGSVAQEILLTVSCPVLAVKAA